MESPRRTKVVVTATGEWWDDANCNQDICTEMMSTAVLNLAGEKIGEEGLGV